MMKNKEREGKDKKETGGVWKDQKGKEERERERDGRWNAKLWNFITGSNLTKEKEIRNIKP